MIALPLFVFEVLGPPYRQRMAIRGAPLERLDEKERQTEFGLQARQLSGWKTGRVPPFCLYAVHVRQLGGESPLTNLMEVKV